MFGYVLSLVFFGYGDNLWFIFLVVIVGILVFVQFIQCIQFKNVIFVFLIGIIFGNVIDFVVLFIVYKYDVVQNLFGWVVVNFVNLLKGDFEFLYIVFFIVLFSYLYVV